MFQMGVKQTKSPLSHHSMEVESSNFFYWNFLNKHANLKMGEDEGTKDTVSNLETSFIFQFSKPMTFANDFLKCLKCPPNSPQALWDQHERRGEHRISWYRISPGREKIAVWDWQHIFMKSYTLAKVQPASFSL